MCFKWNKTFLVNGSMTNLSSSQFKDGVWEWEIDAQILLKK